MGQLAKLEMTYSTLFLVTTTFESDIILETEWFTSRQVGLFFVREVAKLTRLSYTKYEIL